VNKSVATVPAAQARRNATHPGPPRTAPDPARAGAGSCAPTWPSTVIPSLRASPTILRYPPARVLPRQPQHHRDHPGIQATTAPAGRRVGPAPAHQFTVPAQQRRRRNHEHRPTVPRQQPRQRGRGQIPADERNPRAAPHRRHGRFKRRKRRNGLGDDLRTPEERAGYVTNQAGEPVGLRDQRVQKTTTNATMAFFAMAPAPASREPPATFPTFLPTPCDPSRPRACDHLCPVRFSSPGLSRGRPVALQPPAEPSRSSRSTTKRNRRCLRTAARSEARENGALAPRFAGYLFARHPGWSAWGVTRRPSRPGRSAARRRWGEIRCPETGCSSCPGSCRSRWRSTHASSAWA